VLTDNDRNEFRTWLWQELKPRALERQISAQIFDATAERVRFLPAVIERQANQREFSLPIWEYVDIAASEERVRHGRKMLRRHRDLFNRIEQKFGVEPDVVTAVWGLETGYGVVRGDTPTLSALASLAYRGVRARFFEGEFISALRILQCKKYAPDRLIGSWAGALGHCQFMPSAVLDFAVDFDTDGIADICGDDPTDSLASIANYLSAHKWKKGQPWGMEVRLPDEFDYARTGLDQTLASRDLAAIGVTTVDGGQVPDYGPGSILLPAGLRGVAFLVLRNFHVIMRYNNSVAYAIGIGHLSDRILGARQFEANWPRDEQILNRDDVTEAQYLLTQAGFDTLGMDGLPGPNTLRAARAWQIATGLPPDGHIGIEMLARLRSDERH
jgi:lytic murein transglycosylase